MQFSLGSVVSKGTCISKDCFEDRQIGDIFCGEVGGFLFLLLHHCFSLEYVEFLFSFTQLLLKFLFSATLCCQFVLDEFVCLLKVSELVCLSLELALHHTGLFNFQLQLSNTTFVEFFC